MMKKEILEELSLEDFVHSGRIFFFARFCKRQDPCGNRAVTELNVDYITHVHLAARLCHLSVDGDPLRIAGLLRNRAALDQPRVLKKFIYSHYFTPHPSPAVTPSPRGEGSNTAAQLAEQEKSDPDKDRLIHAFVGLLVYGIL